jgi:hypothetical protein
MNKIQFEKFISHHKPIGTPEKADNALLEKYKDLVPSGLLEIWQHHGFGFYGNGFLQLINPDHFHEVLCGWLLREPDPTRIPFMITAFGTVIYYRMLGKDDTSGFVAEDVAFLEPNYRESDVFNWTYKTGMSGLKSLIPPKLDEFFDDFICDEENLKQLFYYENFEIAKEKYGVLEIDNMYCFKLALSLGGSDDIDEMIQGNARVQLDLLLQMC